MVRELAAWAARKGLPVPHDATLFDWISEVWDELVDAVTAECELEPIEGEPEPEQVVV